MTPRARAKRLEHAGTDFRHLDFVEAMTLAAPGNLIYCDPPYLDTQSILYGAQSFSLDRLLLSIADCKARARGIHHGGPLHVEAISNGRAFA